MHTKLAKDLGELMKDHEGSITREDVHKKHTVARPAKSRFRIKQVRPTEKIGTNRMAKTLKL